jgi:hypothetical protein
VYAMTVDGSRFYEVETITSGRRFSMSDPTWGWLHRATTSF